MAINDKQDSVITEIKLAQWQTCVEMANAVSARRDNLNNLFVTVNLALAAAISLVWDVKTIVLLAAGVIECIIWGTFIINYKNLNSAKFAVITELEKQLPVQPFMDEWKIVKREEIHPQHEVGTDHASNVYRSIRYSFLSYFYLSRE